MNYTKLFYWLTVADNAKSMFVTFLVIFSIVAVISTLCFLFGREDLDQNLTADADSIAERSKKWLWWSIPFVILFWSLYIFTPNKRDALLIIAGGQTLNYLTTDSTTKQIPHELSNFVVSELRNMAKDTKVELGVLSAKDKILERAKTMTAAELMKEMRTDSVFAKIILNK